MEMLEMQLKMLPNKVKSIKKMLEKFEEWGNTGQMEEMWFEEELPTQMGRRDRWASKICS